MRNANIIFQFVIAGLAALVAVALFGGFSRSRTPGFRVFPATAAEWVAFWFHTLEFLLFCSMVALIALGRPSLPTARHVPFVRVNDLSTFTAMIALLLLASAVAFWRRDRALCRGAIAWFCAFALFLFIFPFFAGVTKS